MNITSWRYVNDVMQMSINKNVSADVDVLCLEARSRSHDISIFCIKTASSQKCRFHPRQQHFECKY